MSEKPCGLEEGKLCDCEHSNSEYAREPLAVWLRCQAFEVRMDPEQAHRLMAAARIVERLTVPV